MNAVRSPTTTMHRARRKDARPGELLEAALSLFVEKGFAATHVEEVAARAGVSKGTLFVYFPSKEELFKAVVQENASRHLEQAFQEVTQFQGTSAELLRELLRRWWTQYGATPAAGLTKLMMSEAANFPELARYYLDEVVRPSNELMRRVLQRGIDRGEFRPVDTAVVVRLIAAPLLQLVTWLHSVGPCECEVEPIDPLAVVEQHADMLIRGLRPDTQS